MDIFAFKINLVDKTDESPETKYGVILSPSYPKASNALITQYRDDYDIDNIYLDSLSSGNIKILTEEKYNQLITLFNEIAKDDVLIAEL